MPKYQYTAKNMAGRIIEGVYEAPNKEAVINMIRQKSYYHLEVKELVERKDLNESLLGKVKVKDLSIYCKQFASILRAGVPLVQCLGMLGQQTEHKILKNITMGVREEVQKGSSLSQAMNIYSKKLPSILINMVAAGEASGTLDESFETMAEHFEKDYKTRHKVKSAMRYPILVLIVAVIAVALMLVKVVPVFEKLFASSGSELPLPTKILLSMSKFLQKNGFVLLVIIIILAVIVKLILAGENQRLAFDHYKYKMPIFGDFMTKNTAANFARTMSTLMSTGVSITEALDITGKVLQNTYAQKCMKDINDQVKEGKGLFEPIQALDLFPPMLVNMIMLGEESGTIDEMLKKSAIFYEEEVDRAAQGLTSMIEPMIIIVLGGMIAFIVLAIVLPMFGSYSMAA